MSLSGSPIGASTLAATFSAERGDHIWKTPATSDAKFCQVSVSAEDIVTADVLATAIVSGGSDTLALVTERWPVDVIAVDQNGSILMTPALGAQLVDDVALATSA